MSDTYFRMFGKKPKQTYTSPLEKGDHPELDISELLPPEDITKYQSLIGALQWAITLGRIDVQTAVMSMSSFRAAPRQGHLDRVRRIYGYICKMKFAALRFRTGEPDYSDVPDLHYDWAHTVYGDAQEIIPEDLPEPLGKPVLQTAYKDANLCHNMVTGKSVTAVLHLLNQTVIDSFSKQQPTVEVATYGSEFSAARTAVEQMFEIRHTLRYLGVPVRERMYLFGDNQSVVTSSVNPDSKLRKRHQILSYHYVREAIASGVLVFTHIPGEINPADILSKHWGYQQVWPLMKPLLFYEGDTAKLLDPDPVKPEGSNTVLSKKVGSQASQAQDSSLGNDNPNAVANGLDPA